MADILITELSEGWVPPDRNYLRESNPGHAGRPGQRGGSAPGNKSISDSKISEPNELPEDWEEKEQTRYRDDLPPVDYSRYDGTTYKYHKQETYKGFSKRVGNRFSHISPHRTLPNRYTVLNIQDGGSYRKENGGKAHYSKEDAFARAEKYLSGSQDKPKLF